MVDVSVVVPCYNSMDRKQGALRFVTTQLRRQEYDSLEVVLVDGGSSDGTCDLIKELEGTNSLFRGVLPDKPVNRSAARNIGAQRADGEWYVFMDDDCLLLDEWTFAKLNETFESAGFAIGAKRKWFHVGWDPEEIEPELEARDYEALDARTVLPRGFKRKTGKRDLLEYSFLGFFGAVNADSFAAVGGFDEGYQGWGYEDMDLMMRMYHEGMEYTNLFDTITTYHLTHRVNDEDLAQRGGNIERYYSKEESRGIHFRVNRLFGVYDHKDGPIIEPREEEERSVSTRSNDAGLTCVIPTKDSFAEKRGSIRFTFDSIARCEADYAVEVIVVSNSTDGTDEFVEGYEPNGAINAIQLIEDPYEHNRSAARNLGVEEASHPNVVFLDDDVVLVDDQSLTAGVERLEADTFVCGSKRYWLPIGWEPKLVKELLETSPQRLLRKALLPKGINRETGYRALRDVSFVTNFGFVQKEDFQAAGGFDGERFPARYEDMEFMYRCLLNDWTFATLRDIVPAIHLTHQLMAEDDDERIEYLKRFREYEREHGYRFKPNHLVGIYEMDGEMVFEPIESATEATHR